VYSESFMPPISAANAAALPGIGAKKEMHVQKFQDRRNLQDRQDRPASLASLREFFHADR
ncbi:MAG TPA: hypothetical protein VKG25_02760, partial [Bryobacteraceae bacterium]|nr:hypothetical protein [Bryobacteraceae bacterium]